MRKVQINSRISEGISKELKSRARLRGSTESSIVEAALKAFLSQSEHENVLDRRLDKMQKRIERLVDEQQVLLEVLSNFIKVYLSHTPEIPPEQKKRMEDLGLERFDLFLSMVARLLKDKHTLREVLNERIMHESEFQEAN